MSYRMNICFNSAAGVSELVLLAATVPDIVCLSEGKNKKPSPQAKLGMSLYLHLSALDLSCHVSK